LTRRRSGKAKEEEGLLVKTICRLVRARSLARILSIRLRLRLILVALFEECLQLFVSLSPDVDLSKLDLPNQFLRNIRRCCCRWRK
jgi:hypothetical protein